MIKFNRLYFRILLLIAFLAVIFFLVKLNYKKNDYTGTYKRFYPNGALWEEGSLVDGKPHGSSKTYYQNGNIRSEDYFVHGKLHGTIKRYHENGNYFSINTYKYGFVEGLQKQYYSHGQLESTFNVINEQPTGLQKYYYPSGTLKTEQYMIDGKIDGLQKLYYENGNLQSEVNIKKNKKEGEFKFYYKNGKLKSIIQYSNDKKEGTAIYYHQNGILQAEENFFNNKLNGENKYYYKSGKLKQRAIYLNGKRQGEQTWYHENGTLWTTGNYTKGKQNGLKKWFNLKGNLIEEELLKNDKLHGTETKYYDDGSIYKKSQFKNGSLHGLVEKFSPEGVLIYKQNNFKDVPVSLSESFLLDNNLTQPQAWALALTAILTELNHDYHELLGFTISNSCELDSTKTVLQDYWSVKTRKDLLETLDWLETEGHRYKFDTIADDLPDNLSEMDNYDPPQLNKLLTSLFLTKTAVVKMYKYKFSEKSILAWDYFRYIHLCRWGYFAGLLSEEEAWDKIMPIAKELQQTFDSWEDVGENYLVGRVFFSPKKKTDTKKRYKKVYDLLLSSPDSLWNILPWDIDLTTEKESNIE